MYVPFFVFCVLYCCVLFVCKCVLYCCVLFVCKCVLYCCVLFVCKCVLYCTVLLPLGVNPIAVKYISYHIISFYIRTRQTDRQTYRHTDRQTYRQTYRQTTCSWERVKRNVIIISDNYR